MNDPGGRRVILAYAVLAPFIALPATTQSVTVSIGTIVLSHLLLLYPTLRPGCQWLGPVVTRFETDRREVWLTIDDGPDPVHTPRILDLLERYGARATFFVKGQSVRRHPREAAEIARRGHTLGNHSDTHPSAWFWCLGPRRIAREIDRCNMAIRDATGAASDWFRPPVGAKNPFVHPLLARRGMHLIAWSTRGFDAVSTDASAVVARIFRGISPGTIILTHEGGRQAGRPGSDPLDRFDSLLARLSGEGYACVIPEVGRLRTGLPVRPK